MSTEGEDPHEWLHASFRRQTLMATLGGTLTVSDAGHATVGIVAGPDHRQQHGYVHAAVLTAALDTACGYAALSTVDPDGDVLTAELKINLLTPARHPHITATAVTVRRGRTLIVCRGDAYSGDDHVAIIQATLVPIAHRTSPG